MSKIAGEINREMMNKKTNEAKNRSWIDAERLPILRGKARAYESTERGMSDQYQPSNGTEGAMFMDAWCRRCQRDKAMREGADFDECDDNELCEIIAASFRGQVKEWIEDESGPRCTAFIEAGQPVPFVDMNTLSLF